MSAPTHRYVDGRQVPLTQAEIDAWTAAQPSAAEVLATIKAAAVAATKAEARRRIEALTGGGDQELRLLRWAATVADLRNTTHTYPATLPEPWASREAQMQAAAGAVEAIASASNTIEADVPALADAAAVRTWLAAMPTDARWP